MLPGEVICCLSRSVAPAMHEIWGSHSMGLPLALPLGAVLRDDPCHQLLMGCTTEWSLHQPLITGGDSGAHGFEQSLGLVWIQHLLAASWSNYTWKTNQVGRKTQPSLWALIFQWIQPPEPKRKVNPHPAGRAGKETSCPENPRQQHQQKATLPVGAGRMIRQQRSPQGLVSFRSFVLQIARLVWGY